MRYYAVRLKQKQEDQVYRIYVTDALYALTNRGQRMAKRYIDVVNPDRKVIDEDRTPEEIINNIRDKLKVVSAE